MAVLLTMEDVEKKYGSNYTNPAVQGISLQIGEGEFWLLLGSNGAGKSTLMSMLATVQKPSSGRIYYRGQDIVKSPGCLRSVMGYVPQEIALYPSLSGRANLRFFGESYHIPKKELDSRIAVVQEQTGLTDSALCKKVGTYSGGMKRRLNIGAALLHRPEILLLDEPTAGIDDSSRQQIIQMLDGLHRNGTAIVMIEHNLQGMQGIYTHVAQLKDGALHFCGGAQQWSGYQQ